MLRLMGFVAQWRRVAQDLPAGWTEASLRLALTREADASRAARLLGPLGPGRRGNDLHVLVTPAGSAGPAAVERLLTRLDAEGIAGTLELASSDVVAAPPLEAAAELHPSSIAEEWAALVRALPEDWSDLLCLLELRSSDDLDRAALAVAPLNPARHGGTVAFRFRVARRFGYGAAPMMARRCLARLDEQEIPGTVSLLEGFSGSRPVLTQGPTFVVSGRAV
jgi:hypothetical protein